MSLLDDILATKLQEVTQSPEVRALKAQVQELQECLASKTAELAEGLAMASQMRRQASQAVLSQQEYYTKSRVPRPTASSRPWGPSGPTGPDVSIKEHRDPLTMDRLVTASVRMTVSDLEYYKGQNIEFLVQELSDCLASILLNSQPPRITGTPDYQTGYTKFTGGL